MPQVLTRESTHRLFARPREHYKETACRDEVLQEARIDNSTTVLPAVDRPHSPGSQRLSAERKKSAADGCDASTGTATVVLGAGGSDLDGWVGTTMKYQSAPR